MEDTEPPSTVRLYFHAPLFETVNQIIDYQPNS